MRSKPRYCGQLQNHVWVANFCGSSRKTQYGRPSRSSWTESTWSSFQRIYGKNLRDPIAARLRKRVSSWECLFVHRESHKIGWKESESWSDVENTKPRSRCGRTNIFCWSCILRLHSKTKWNKQRYCGQLQSHVWIANFSRGEQKNFHSRKIFVFLHGLMKRKVMQRNVWSDTVS